MTYIDILNEKVNIKKEVLGTLPVNNKKNIKKYVEELEKTKKEFEKHHDDIVSEINRRYDKKIPVKSNSEKLQKLRKEKIRIQKVLYILNNINTPYEKMGLDKRLHKLKYYYKNNFKDVNEVIFSIIMSFKEVGITLKIDDFVYSKFSRDYIQMFLNGINSKTLDIDKIKEFFDETYWKCPDIILHIELSFRLIYLKHEKQLIKYFEKQKNILTKKITDQEIIDKYLELIKREDVLKKDDSENIIKAFLNQEENIKEFDEKEIFKKYSKYVSEQNLNEIFKSEDKLKELDERFIELKYIVYEFKDIKRYGYIIQAIKKRYDELKNDKNLKNEYKQILKEIVKKEKRISSITNKTKSKIIKKEITEAELVEQNNIIKNLQELYRRYDEAKLNNTISENINDSSNYLDIINLANSFYRENVRLARSVNPEAEPNDIETLIAGMKKIVISPYLTILNNYNINEEKNLIYVIKDRYRLLNIKLNEEMLEEENLDKIIEDCKFFEKYYYIRKNNIDLKQINEYCELKKVLDLEKKRNS